MKIKMSNASMTEFMTAFIGSKSVSALELNSNSEVIIVSIYSTNPHLSLAFLNLGNAPCERAIESPARPNFEAFAPLGQTLLVKTTFRED